MGSPTRTFIANYTRLLNDEIDAVDLLVHIADEIGTVEFNEIVASFDEAEAEAYRAQRERDLDEGNNIIIEDRGGRELDVSATYRFAHVAYRSPANRPSKVDVIKELRRVSGLGLKEAKCIVDDWFETFDRLAEKAGAEALREIEAARERPQTLGDLIRNEMDRTAAEHGLDRIDDSSF